MRISKQKNTWGKVLSYTMWLSADDTYSWSATWPCSQLKDRKVMVVVDDNGVCDFTVKFQNSKDMNMENVENQELVALVRDHLPYDCRHLWPLWEEEQ